MCILMMKMKIFQIVKVIMNYVMKIKYFTNFLQKKCKLLNIFILFWIFKIVII